MKIVNVNLCYFLELKSCYEVMECELGEYCDDTENSCKAISGMYFSLLDTQKYADIT